MRFLWQKPERKFEDTLRRLVKAMAGTLSGYVTPQTCMASPTVHAIVTAVSRRLASTTIGVYQTDIDDDGLATLEAIPNHSVANLLARPNQWQSPYDFWQDAASTFVRFGRFYASKTQRAQGRILELLPLDPSQVSVKQDEDWNVTYCITQNAQIVEKSPRQIFHARGPARNFVEGNSPVDDCSVAIALEVLAEKFGANFFKNGALPLLLFEYQEGSMGFETEAEEKQFLADVKEAFGGDNMLTSMLVPKGIKAPETINIDHDKAQFLETRKYQRTVIAGAFGVPPHLVGDLERGTFNNVEQQDKDFTQNVIMPVAQAFEAAMERDLLTRDDYLRGVRIRFDLDTVMRASFKDRQEGLRIQREMGIISANEWRVLEGRNPRPDEEGGEYLHPSNMVVDGDDDAPESDSQPGNQTPFES